MKITLVLGEMFIIPLVLRIRGIINISPNTRGIFHEHFSNRIFFVLINPQESSQFMQFIAITILE